MTKRHYIPITADVPGASSERNCALIRKTIRTVLALERVALPCEVDVLPVSYTHLTLPTTPYV